VLDGQRMYLATDRSLVVNMTRDPEVARSSLGAVYTCHVTNGMTSDIQQVRLASDVISGVADWSTLSWMSVNSITGIIPHFADDFLTAKMMVITPSCRKLVFPLARSRQVCKEWKTRVWGKIVYITIQFNSFRAMHEKSQ